MAPTGDLTKATTTHADLASSVPVIIAEMGRYGPQILAARRRRPGECVDLATVACLRCGKRVAWVRLDLDSTVFVTWLGRRSTHRHDRRWQAAGSEDACRRCNRQVKLGAKRIEHLAMRGIERPSPVKHAA